MYNFSKIYSRQEIVQIQRECYNGYKILERNYKKNDRGISYDRYKVIEIIPDVSSIDSPNEITIYDGIIIIEMIEKNDN